MYPLTISPVKLTFSPLSHTSVTFKDLLLEPKAYYTTTHPSLPHEFKLIYAEELKEIIHLYITTPSWSNKGIKPQHHISFHKNAMGLEFTRVANIVAPGRKLPLVIKDLQSHLHSDFKHIFSRSKTLKEYSANLDWWLNISPWGASQINLPGTIIHNRKSTTIWKKSSLTLVNPHHGPISFV